MDRTATLTRPVRRWQTNAAPPPKLNSSSPADESVRLADKRPLNPPMLDGVASPFLLPLSLLPSPAPTQNIMRRLAFALLFSFTTASLSALAQEDNSEVRVSVVLNADGSRTVYESNAANRKTVATTTGKDGKLREKIRYELDENGRFARAEVLGPKEQFRFFAEYKYDGSNHLIEETHFAKDQSVIGKIVFRYDAAGHQIGYSSYDGAGKLLGQTVAPTASPAKRK